MNDKKNTFHKLEMVYTTIALYYLLKGLKCFTVQFTHEHIHTLLLNTGHNL